MRRDVGTLLIALGCTTSSVAAADVEVAGIAGAHVFSGNNELGTRDVMNAPSPRNSVLLGARVGVGITDLIGVEAELGIVPTAARDLDYSLTALTYRAHVMLRMNATSRWRPFVLLGAGFFSVVQTGDDSVMGDPDRDITKDTDAMLYAGLGIAYRAGEAWGVRLDARLLLPPSSDNTDQDVDSRTLTADVEALASVYVTFGRTAAPPPPVPEPPPPPPPPPAPEPPPPPPVVENPDRDADTIANANDQCPDEPETVNSYQDEDGCPDTIPRPTLDDMVKRFAERILFPFNKSVLEPDSTTVIGELAALMQATPEIELLSIQGHSSKDGEDKHNRKLSRDRAQAAYDALVAAGVAAARLQVESFGSAKPAVAGKAEEQRRQNRRVEFKIVKFAGTPAPAPAP